MEITLSSRVTVSCGVVAWSGTLGDFFFDNEISPDGDHAAEIVSDLESSGSHFGGGGAAAEFTILAA